MVNRTKPTKRTSLGKTHAKRTHPGKVRSHPRTRKLTVSITMSYDLLDRIDKLADAQDATRSALIVDALEDAFGQADAVARVVVNPRVMSAFTKAFSAPGVLTAMSEALGHQLSRDETQQVLSFLKSPKGSAA